MPGIIVQCAVHNIIKGALNIFIQIKFDNLRKSLNELDIVPIDLLIKLRPKTRCVIAN